MTFGWRVALIVLWTFWKTLHLCKRSWGKATTLIFSLTMCSGIVLGVISATLTMIALAVVNTVQSNHPTTKLRAEKSCWKIWGKNVCLRSYHRIRPSGSTTWKGCIQPATTILMSTAHRMLMSTWALIGSKRRLVLKTHSQGMIGATLTARTLLSTLRSKCGRSMAPMFTHL